MHWTLRMRSCSRHHMSAWNGFVCYIIDFLLHSFAHFFYFSFFCILVFGNFLCCRPSSVGFWVRASLVYLYFIVLYCWEFFCCLWFNSVHLWFSNRDVDRTHRGPSAAVAARWFHKLDAQSYPSSVEPHRLVSKHVQWEAVWTAAGELQHSVSE